MTQELDLFTEYCLQCESLLVTDNSDEGAAMMRDCADLNILLTVFINRKSELEQPLIKCCLEAWKKCKYFLIKYQEKPEFEKCYDVCSMCIEDFEKYV